MTKRTVMVAIVASLLMAPSALRAATAYDAEQSLTPFVWTYYYLSAGTQYTIETKNLTAGGDTVLYVLYPNGSTFQQIAANDDNPAPKSKVVFTAPYNAYYAIWVRAYAYYSGGKADIVVNGSTVLTQAQFGGVSRFMMWNSGEQFRVAPTRFTNSEDSMIFLLRSNAEFLQRDDDSGPLSSAFAQASSSENTFNSRAVYGLYPGATGSNYGRLLVQSPPSFMNDADGDGLTDALESLITTLSNNNDSDNDGIPDAIETIGGNDSWSWTFSRSSTAPYGNNPIRRNVHVEIDYMINTTDPSKSRQPYANLPIDTSAIFTADGNVDVTAIIDNSVPWHQNIGFDGCAPNIPDCEPFYTQKASYFSTSYPERKPYFHYAIFGYRYNNGCSSGLAETLGNDLIITLGCASFLTAEQRGTFIHESGHNFNLSHNFNGNDNGNNSTVHNSVMNYRYQVSGTSPSGRHTYSFGNGGCGACATSPKQQCIDLNSGGFCGSPPGLTCDCDLNEWGMEVNYDMTEGGNLNDGASYTSPVPTASPIAEPINLHRPSGLAALIEKAPDKSVSPREFAAALSNELKKLVPQDPAGQASLTRLAQAKQDEADSNYNRTARAASTPTPNMERRRASVAKRVADLKSKGLVDGVDFRVSSNGASILMP